MTTVGNAAENDPTIPNAERLLRRVHPRNIVPDYNLNRWRPSSAAFDDAEDGVSVFISSIITDELNLTEADAVSSKDESLVVLTASDARCDAVQPPLGVKRDPDPSDAPPHPCSSAHALLVGAVKGKPGDKQQRRPLSKLAREWVVERPPIDNRF